MRSKTNEQALESAIQKALTGIISEEDTEDEIREPSVPFGGNGYLIGFPRDYNKKYAIDEVRLWNFLETTHKEELEKLKKHSDYKLKILERLDRIIKKDGILKVLKKGIQIDDAHFTMFYQLPLESSSNNVKENFQKNQFSITRQVQYSEKNPLQEIDMVLFINGLALITMELKNAWTGQTARIHGIKQYKEDRDITQPLLNFGRCIVHFAVDTDEVYMTTRLDGKKTFFLPFNKGNNNGKGNPVNFFGHKSDYLWKKVLSRESLANIIQHFVTLEGKTTDPLSKKRIIFPRYHQLDVVRKLLADVGRNGIGQTYLIQHSAGSGKSNSITWAAYQLIEAYPESSQVVEDRSSDQPIFDSVIVVTDRRLLDKQLRDNIKEFSEVKNIVAPAYYSKDLKEALENGKKIIITTIQKFPFIVDGIADLSNKRFAVIIDEAHSSQSGTAAGKMNEAMGNSQEDDNEEDIQDKILKAIQTRKMKGNASYFAFTATPKNTTLERFGRKDVEGKFRPFHLYSMKQAIEEGFILDVLANYTTYRSYYEIEKSITENPLFDSKKAQRKLRNYVESNKATIGTKAEIMMEHFISKIFSTKKLKGKAKGMVVTQNIESAIRYYKTIEKYLKEHGNPFKVAIAFSGKKIVDGIEYTEADINGFPETETAKEFDSDEYRILVVANKYLTGFDQPKLCAMYVDKKLQGVLAVQALSRLNRSANDLGKKTEDLFILDFFNTTAEIKDSFDPFYTATSLSGATDINVLHDLKEKLDETGVYDWHEVEDFIEKYFSGVDAQELSPIIDYSAQRFNDDLELEDKEKVDYKIKAKQFVKIYSQMASIMPYEIPDWEKLFWFLKFLIPKLKVKTREDELLDELLETVDLSSYGLERTKLNVAISLEDAEAEVDPQNSNMRGAHGMEEEKNHLDEIIKNFNDRYFQGWEATPEEQKVKFVSLMKDIKKHKDYEEKVAKNKDTQNRDLAFTKILEDVMREHRRKEIELYKNFVNDSVFRNAFENSMKNAVMNELIFKDII